MVPLGAIPILPVRQKVCGQASKRGPRNPYEVPPSHWRDRRVAAS